MGGATSVHDACHQGRAFSQWADTIDWTVRCDWLQAASVVTCTCGLQVLTSNFYPASFMVVVMWVLASSGFWRQRGT